MKPCGKRLVSLLLAAFLAFGALPGGALAAGNREAPEAEFALETDVFDGAYDSGDFYNQLTTRQKACYDAMAAVTMEKILRCAPVELEGKTYRQVTLHVEGIDGTVMKGGFQKGEFVPSSAYLATESGIYTDLCAAIVALRYDRPDLLWLGSLRYTYKTVEEGGTYRVSYAILSVELEYGGKEQEMQDSMMEKAKAIAERASQAPDTYQKVKSVHDQLVEANIYGDDRVKMAHTAYSALVPEAGCSPVCDGYAKAFKVVCGLMGIPCVTPSSKEHMWNNVKMDDGNWYHVDLTWDDAGEGPVLDYFLVGSQTVIGGESFSKQEDHVEQNPYHAYFEKDPSGSLNNVVLKYPEKSKNAYEYLGADYGPLPFPDVKRGTWYFSEVEAASGKGLFGGNTNGLFEPDRPINRAEFAKVLAKALGADLSGYTESGFNDVPAGKWYTAPAAWAEEKGYMKGYSGNLFRPTDPISRQEMCAVLYRAMPDKPDLDGFRFADDAQISGWAKDGVYACRALGIVSGGGGNRFDPQSSTLRCQAAKVFNRFSNLLEK